MKALVRSLLVLLFLITYLWFKNAVFYYNQKDKIVFLDVGAGDSILLLSENEGLLIDGGDSYAYAGLLSKYLGNKKPWVYIVTHSHVDHISGISYLVSSATNYDVFKNNQDLQTFSVKHFNDTAYASTNTIDTDTSITFKNFTIKVLWPDPNCKDSNPNYCSVVLLVTHINGNKALLMSDSEQSAQLQYIKQVPDVDIIKVPHQGSRDSFYPKLIEVADPDYAVVSIGKNSWGHPHKEVIDYYKQKGIKVFRTDYNGDVIFEFR